MLIPAIYRAVYRVCDFATTSMYLTILYLVMEVFVLIALTSNLQSNEELKVTQNCMNFSKLLK